MLATAAILVMGGCEGMNGPDLRGEIELSSQLFGTESYYIVGFSYEDGEYYKFPYAGEPKPDIINEGYLVIEGNKQISRPGFNTPGRVNGFALLEEFTSLKDAYDFFNGYSQVEEGLQLETVSDTVKLFQVWLQQTPAGNYVKMVIKNIQLVEVESGRPYNEVLLEYIYQPDGSKTFPPQ